MSNGFLEEVSAGNGNRGMVKKELDSIIDDFGEMMNLSLEIARLIEPVRSIKMQPEVIEPEYTAETYEPCDLERKLEGLHADILEHIVFLKRVADEIRL